MDPWQYCTLFGANQPPILWALMGNSFDGSVPGAYEADFRLMLPTRPNVNVIGSNRLKMLSVHWTSRPKEACVAPQGGTAMDPLNAAKVIDPGRF